MSTLISKNNNKPSFPQGYVGKTGVLNVPLLKVMCFFCHRFDVCLLYSAFYSKSSHVAYELLVICISIK